MEPYFIITNPAVNGGDDIVRSVDAIYEHALFHNYDDTQNSATGTRPPELDTRTATDITVESWWKPKQAFLRGKTNFKTGPPVLFMPGAMPQLHLHDRRRGYVSARSKSDVVYMFERARAFAPVTWARRSSGVVEIEKTLCLTDFNEWVEGHTIEPCRETSPRAADGSYNANHE